MRNTVIHKFTIAAFKNIEDRVNIHKVTIRDGDKRP